MRISEVVNHQFKTAYHITLSEDAEEILAVGLQPSDGLIYLMVNEGDKAKLKREISQVGGWMYAKTEGSDDPLVLLKVNIDGIPLEKSRGWYVASVPIEPSRITNMGELSI